MGIESHRHHNETARRRWGLLARALTSNSNPSRPPGNEVVTNQPQDLISVRRISNFGLIKISPLIDVDWFVYSAGDKFCMKIRHLNQILTPEDLMGFNNTGNVCVWPSEEVLAYYALGHREEFFGKSVLELGGGMSCLAGLYIAKYTDATRVHLTDGNENSVKNVRRIVAANRLDHENDGKVDCSVLKWGEHVQDKYDIVLAADCLFFDSARRDLVRTIWQAMKSNGVGWITAPRRGSTLDKFLEEAQNVGFKYRVSDSYNQDIWDRHLALNRDCNYYNMDIHYPVFIILTKSL
ncbi:Putative methyltransferase [Nesidiocoris tenuis]|uniref:Calmodulin-lysine N-methyltransferase n=1 Tax=Nesidiocoris tenuis TaxID=355587 RepID=A0ABN7APE1_9HEMI|nr:Putative methyltransferase [Nesidiocoris tenuis]